VILDGIARIKSEPLELSTFVMKQLFMSGRRSFNRRYYQRIWWRHDLPAGISVFLVALPLCLGIAMASGAPIYSGVLSGIIGGIVVSLISGSSLGVSGPAAGLTTVVGASIVSLGDFRIFLLTVLIAGVFQILLGILRLGVLASYFPSAVIKGMLAAIGIILISKQIPIAIGYDQPDFWTSGFPKLFSSGSVWSNLGSLSQHSTRGALVITAGSLILYMVFKQPWMKKAQKIPLPLLIVVFGVVLNILFSFYASSFSLRTAQLVSIPGQISEAFIFPDFSFLFSKVEIWRDGLVIGLLATLETLLCVEAVDKLDRHNRITPVNRELVAQGVGNVACGLVGAIPITAVIVRGAANVDAGARTKMSAFTHGLLLLITVAFVPFILNKIPYAALATILLVTGYNLAKPKLFRNMWGLGWKQFLPFIITIVVILATDLLVGVCIGILISTFFIIHNNFKAEYKVSRMHMEGLDTYVIKLNTNVTFLNKVNLRKTLDQIPEYSVLTIDGGESNFIDYDILEVISEYSTKAKERHIELHLKGVQEVNVTAVH
jgi:MFS superfamily sulfate permease-like transporter